MENMSFSTLNFIKRCESIFSVIQKKREEHEKLTLNLNKSCIYYIFIFDFYVKFMEKFYLKI